MSKFIIFKTHQFNRKIIENMRTIKNGDFHSSTLRLFIRKGGTKRHKNLVIIKKPLRIFLPDVLSPILLLSPLGIYFYLYRTLQQRLEQCAPVPPWSRVSYRRTWRQWTEQPPSLDPGSGFQELYPLQQNQQGTRNFDQSKNYMFL